MTRITGTAAELNDCLIAGIRASAQYRYERRTLLPPLTLTWWDLLPPEEFGPRDALPMTDTEDD